MTERFGYRVPMRNLLTRSGMGLFGALSLVVAACGGSTSGTTVSPDTACNDAAGCKADNSALIGVCVGSATDGAACDPAKGPSCLPPARCSNGVCTITDPATCK
jgi:hypothetical protein